MNEDLTARREAGTGGFKSILDDSGSAPAPLSHL